MNEKVVDIGDFRLERACRSDKRRFQSGDKCAHNKLTLDACGQTITCDDCNLQVSAYWVLDQICQELRIERESLRNKREEINADERKRAHLKAARRISKIWHGGKYAVSCPHCHRGILPSDGLGMMQAEFELAQRKKKGPTA